MAQPRPWTRDELLVAFRLYCRTPFGRLHQRNPDIISLARLLNRTPAAVAMKACNFASLDPMHQARGVAALKNVSRADRSLWEQFNAAPESIALEAEEAFAKLQGNEPYVTQELHEPEGPTEIERITRARRVQGFFRAAVLASYDFRCALSGIAVVELLNASHIVPWSVDPQRRADPRNGICLNALYDRAFDRGLLTFDDSFRVVLSPLLRVRHPTSQHRQMLLHLECRRLRLPARFVPGKDALAYHREHIFRNA